MEGAKEETGEESRRAGSGDVAWQAAVVPEETRLSQPEERRLRSRGEPPNRAGMLYGGIVIPAF